MTKESYTKEQCEQCMLRKVDRATFDRSGCSYIAENQSVCICTSPCANRMIKYIREMESVIRRASVMISDWNSSVGADEYVKRCSIQRVLRDEFAMIRRGFCLK